MPQLDRARRISDELLSHVEDRVDWIGYRSPVAETTRAAAILFEAAEYLRSEDESLGHAVDDMLRRLLAGRDRGGGPRLAPAMIDRLSALRDHVGALLAGPRPTHGPWKDTVVSDATRRVPTMLTEETMRYYRWLGEQASGAGRIVEIGAWLGSSTRCLCEGLEHSRAAGPSIDVYDSFVWCRWMDSHVRRYAGDRWPKAGESFLGLFLEGLRGHEGRISAHPCWFEDVPRAGGTTPEWARRQPIELLVYDMGPERPILDAIWGVFSPYFIRGTTVLVFNEYGKVHASEMWDFCADRSDCLRPHHKPNAHAKSFLFV